MNLPTPVVPPFPISDYGTGCMGAIAALTGLFHRATKGGSYHGRASLMHYDLLLFAVGQYSSAIQDEMRASLPADFFGLRHCDSVDRISSTVLRLMQKQFPHLYVSGALTEKWHSSAYDADVEVARPVAEIRGVDNGFVRASRPNGADQPDWDGFGSTQGDYKCA